MTAAVTDVRWCSLPFLSDLSRDKKKWTLITRGMFPTLAVQGVHKAAEADIPTLRVTIYSAIRSKPCSALCHGSSVSCRFPNPSPDLCHDNGWIIQSEDPLTMLKELQGTERFSY